MQAEIKMIKIKKMACPECTSEDINLNYSHNCWSTEALPQMTVVCDECGNHFSMKINKDYGKV